jgi:hypothetical protein
MSLIIFTWTRLEIAVASFSLAALRKGFWRCAFSVPAIAFYLLLPPAKVLAQEPTKELIEAAKKGGQLTFWSTTGEVALQIFAPFLKRYGLKLEVVDGSANALVERVITESQAGTYTPDLLNTSLEWLTFVDEKELLASDFKWPNISKWGFKQPLLPKVAVIGIEPRPAIFNMEMIPQKEWPRGPIEKALVNPKFEGLSALSTSSEEFPMVYAYLWGSADKLNWERSFAFFERLAKVTKPRAVRGYTPSQRLLAAGDFGLLHFGLFSRAFRDARDGAPVGVGAVEPMTASLVNIVIMKHFLASAMSMILCVLP